MIKNQITWIYHYIMKFHTTKHFMFKLIFFIHKNKNIKIQDGKTFRCPGSK